VETKKGANPRLTSPPNFQGVYIKEETQSWKAPPGGGGGPGTIVVGEKGISPQAQDSSASLVSCLGKMSNMSRINLFFCHDCILS